MRLTYKAQDQNGKETGTVWYASTAGDSIFPKSDKEEQVLKKLAAYEDTGLTPEEFHESVAFVLELNKKLKPYMDAEEQGLLVRLPCKIGTDCWRVNFNRRRHPIEQIRFDVTSYNVFGKTVFLSREEAEAALKGEMEDV